MMTPRIHALIPAAGQSVRFGGTTLKQYAHILGKPVIAHSIDAVCQHPAVSSVTVALAQDDGIYDELIRPAYPWVNTVIGGDVRARTVHRGLLEIRSVDPECEWVLIHDAARPCLEYSALDRLISQGLNDESGAILAIQVSDTLKRASEAGRIDETQDRSGLWRAQTPQLFPLESLLRSMHSAVKFGRPPTDEAEAMERAGFQPLLVQGRASNIKITGAEDLALAEFILAKIIEAGERA